MVPRRQQDRSNRDLVVYVLGLLGGEYRRINTEDIAIKCFELFSDVFSWTKYPQYPDKDIVRVALTDARKEKNGALVEGRAGQALGHHSSTKRNRTPDGWILSRAGIDWLRSEQANMENYSESRELRDHRQLAMRRIKRLKDHEAWKMYGENVNSFAPSIGLLSSLLRCRVDAPYEVWQKRFDEMDRDIATSNDNTELEAFLERCREAYENQR